MISPKGTYGESNFAHAQLGDSRRTKRLVSLADLMTRRPGGALPQKLNNPKDLKAFYRLEHFHFYCATYPELRKQFRQSLVVTVRIALDIAL
jgi:hypothetical protein